MRRLRFVPLALASLLAIFPTANAASAKSGAAASSIRVSVQDALGRPIEGARLDLRTAGDQNIAHGKSDSHGRFVFTPVRPGNYLVRASKKMFKPAAAPAAVAAGQRSAVALSMQSDTALSLAIVAPRVDRPRNGLASGGAASAYHFDQKAIEQLPQGANTSLNDVLLQAPGVVQDSFGQLHVRGDHGNLQYRINGVQLPEGITGFGQALSPRFAKSISLLDGALPAQFGLRTAGIVDIKTKDGLQNSGDAEFYGGQRGTYQPSFEYGGSSGTLNYFVTAQYLQNDRGIEPPTSGPTAIHDTINGGSVFSYFSKILSPSLRLSLITGAVANHFEIPANPGQPQAFILEGTPFFPSANVDENQFEQNYFGVFALQGEVGANFDYQIAPFSRYSNVSFNPDFKGDLIFNGAASKVFRSDWGNGFQIDTSYRGFDRHTVSAGAFFDSERAEIDNHEAVFPASDGQQSGTTPLSITDNNALLTWTYSGYLEDEWQPTAKLTINTGVRFDLYDGLVRADQASPRFALAYKPVENLTLHAAYARYFTPPATELVSLSSIQKFEGTTGAPPSTGNSTPTVEREHYFDVGAIVQPASGLSLGVDTYYKKAVDLIDEGQFGPAFIFQDFNYHKARIYGVELTSSYGSENFYTYLNFGYSVAQGTQIESGQFNFTPDELAFINSHYVFLDHDQTFSSSQGAVYDFNGFQFSVDSIYGSGLRRGFANTGNLPYYIQVDAGISKNFRLPEVGGLQLRVAVVNLFDRTYQIRNGTGIGVFADQFGPRRALYGGIKWELPFTKPKPLLP